MLQGTYLPYEVAHYSEAAQRAVVAEFSLARPLKQAFRSDRELLFSMNSLQSAQLVLLKIDASLNAGTKQIAYQKSRNLPVPE